VAEGWWRVNPSNNVIANPVSGTFLSGPSGDVSTPSSTDDELATLYIIAIKSTLTHQTQITARKLTRNYNACQTIFILEAFSKLHLDDLGQQEITVSRTGSRLSKKAQHI